MQSNPIPFTSKSRYNQFLQELETVKELNGKSCPFKREGEVLDQDLYARADKTLPIIRQKLPKNVDFSSEILTSARGNLLNEKNYGEYSIFDSAVRSCYIKDTILDAKKVSFANNTTENKISSGAFGSVALYKDKTTGLPIASGKFVVDYTFRYNKNLFETDMNFETVHESLIGLELVNKCKYLLPSYPSTYGMGYCDINKKGKVLESCRMRNATTISTDAPVVFIEYLNKSFTLKDFIAGTKVAQDVVLNNIQSIYLQIFNALNVLYMMNGCYTHYDLHDANVLIRILDEEILIPIYTFGEDEILKEIKYLRTKYVAHVIDYGLSTFLSYETLSREFHKQSSKYYGKTPEQIRTEFIFGNGQFPNIFNSKKADPAFDIYKILGFSSYDYNNSTKGRNVPQKKDILRFFGVLYKVMLQKNDISSYELITTYLLNGDEERNRYFSKPANMVSPITYNFLVEYLSNYPNIIPTARPIEIFTESQILSNEVLSNTLSSNCLNPNCIINLENQFNAVYKGENTKNYRFFPAQFDDLKKLLVKRRLHINEMIVALSLNVPGGLGPNNFNRNTMSRRNVLNNPTTSLIPATNLIPTNNLQINDKVVVVVQLVLYGGKIYQYEFNFPKITSGKEITDKLLLYPEIANHLYGTEFKMYISENLENYAQGERIYDDSDFVNLEGIKYIVYEDKNKGFFGNLLGKIGL